MNLQNYACIAAAFVLLSLVSLDSAARGLEIEKLVDTTLYPHDHNGVFRWSEGVTFVLDEQQKHLMMLVTAFGNGGHDDSVAEILRFDSLDGGLTWSPLEQAHVFQENIGNKNVMSPSLVRVNENEILGVFNVINSLSNGGPYMKRSYDNGTTWTSPVSLPYEGYGATNPDGAMRLSNGRILLPAWASFDQLQSDYAYCFYSDDNGENWQKSAYMTTPMTDPTNRANPAAEEPAVVELADHRLMMLIRTYHGSFYKSYSEDFGATWSDPVDSGISAPGAMPTLKRMPNGQILLIYNSAPSEEEIDGPFPRNYLSAAVSTDEGDTFQELGLLDGGDDFPGKITMANVTFFDGNAIITYSKSMDLTNSYNWQLQVIPESEFAIHTPEPTTACLLIIGLLGMIVYRGFTRIHAIEAVYRGFHMGNQV